MDFSLGSNLLAGRHHDGNPATGLRRSRLEGEFINMVGDELVGLIGVAGLEPAYGERTQVAEAVRLIAEDVAGIRFPTLAAALDSDDISSGDVVAILGFTAEGDGGGFTGKVEEVDNLHYPGGGRIKPVHTGVVSAAWWGVVGDYDTTTSIGTDWTDTFNSILAFFKRTGPPYRAGWGQGTIDLPKGNILVNGTISTNSHLGLIFRGAASDATVIVSNVDDDSALIYLNTYVGVTFRDLSFYHDPDPATAQENWQRRVFDLDGTGGGRGLVLERVRTRGFAKIFRTVFGHNEAATSCNGCEFIGCHVFADSESSQAVINSFNDCFFGGGIFYLLHVAGYGNTIFNTCNIIIDGTVLKFKNVSNTFGQAGFVFDNTKFEWTAAHQAAGANRDMPKIIDADGTAIRAVISLRDTQLTGGPSPADTVRWAHLNAGGVRVSVERSAVNGRVSFGAQTSNLLQEGYGLRMQYVRIGDPADWVWDSTGSAGGSSFPVVSLEGCTIDDGGQPIYLTMTGPDGNPRSQATPWINPVRHVALGEADASARLAVNALETKTVDYPVFGQRVWLDRARIFVLTSANNGTDDRTITLYKDAARSSVIGTLTLPNGSISNKMYDIPLTESFVTEGIYASVANASGVAAFCHIYLDFASC